MAPCCSTRLLKMPIELQAKLLRVLEDRKFRPLGSGGGAAGSRRWRARLTHVDLERRIAEEYLSGGISSTA